MADEKSKIDEAARIEIATLVVEARVSVEAASVGLEMLVTREGNTPELVTAGKHLVQAREALSNLDDLIRKAAPMPEADANG